MQDALTLAKITADHGGSRAAFAKTPVKDWLYQQNNLNIYADKLENSLSQAGKNHEKRVKCVREIKNANP